MKVLFIGDSPSAKNTNPNVAFEGTASGKRLQQWADYLGVAYFATNSDDEERLRLTIRTSEIFNQPIITLGATARRRTEKVLKKNGYVVNLYHLPHPSFRNRIFNEAGRERAILDECKKWLGT